MALFINVDPVAPHWWKRKVYRGWQFGYSGGTKNDFMLDVEVARWRFACYIGFKYQRNPSPRQARHEQWRKDKELARERANRPEPAYRRLWGSLRGTQAPGYRMDQKFPLYDHAFAFTQLVLAAKRLLRLQHIAPDSHDQRRRQLAARASVPEPILRNAAAPLEGELLRQEHQGSASDHIDHSKSETVGLSKEPHA